MLVSSGNPLQRRHDESTANKKVPDFLKKALSWPGVGKHLSLRYYDLIPPIYHVFLQERHLGSRSTCLASSLACFEGGLIALHKGLVGHLH